MLNLLSSLEHCLITGSSAHYILFMSDVTLLCFYMNCLVSIDSLLEFLLFPFTIYLLYRTTGLNVDAVSAKTFFVIRK